MSQVIANKRVVRDVSPFTIDFGTPVRFPGPKVGYDSRTAVNGHMLVAGPSGSGKTYQLDRLIDAVARQGVRRVIVINAHGDLCANLSSDVCQTFRFSEQGQYGLSPLDILDDHDVGGVRRRANSFISLLCRQGALGARQKTALFRLLVDGYSRFGFLIDDPKTWGLGYDPRPPGSPAKRYPTLKDLQGSIWRRYQGMRTGQSVPAATAFEQVIRLTQARARLRGRAGKACGEDLNRVEQQLVKARAEALDMYREGMEAMDTGAEAEDILMWENAENIKSLFDRIEALERAGIFKGAPAPFDESVPVWNYDISSLTDDEQAMFVDCLLERVYLDAKRGGETNGPDCLVVLDEAHKFVVDEGDHILNKLVKEARKWGVGLVLASQSFTHFSDDLLMSSAVKLVLGCPEMYKEPMRRKLGLDMVELKTGKKVNPLSFIKPQQTAMVSVSTRGESKPMIEVQLTA